MKLLTWFRPLDLPGLDNLVDVGSLDLLAQPLMIELDQGVMGLVHRTAERIRGDHHPEARVNGAKDRCQHANIRLAA